MDTVQTTQKCSKCGVVKQLTDFKESKKSLTQQCEVKKCSECGVDKILSSFSINREYKDRVYYQKKCKECCVKHISFESKLSEEEKKQVIKQLPYFGAVSTAAFYRLCRLRMSEAAFRQWYKKGQVQDFLNKNLPKST